MRRSRRRCGPGWRPGARAAPEDGKLKFSQGTGAQSALSPRPNTAPSAPGRRFLVRAEQLQPRCRPSVNRAQLQAVHLQRRTGQWLYRPVLVNDAPSCSSTNRSKSGDRRTTPIHVPGPIRMREALYVAQPGVDPLAAGHGRGPHHRLHRQVRLQQAGTCPQPVAGTGHHRPDAPMEIATGWSTLPTAIRSPLPDRTHRAAAARRCSPPTRLGTARCRDQGVAAPEQPISTPPCLARHPLPKPGGAAGAGRAERIIDVAPLSSPACCRT